jgi:Tfp pilus assembly protein PilO
MIIMLLPALIVIFLIGWFMYWIDNQDERDKTQRKPPKKDNVTLMPIIFEERQEIVNE